jgi:hypothetical protein
LKPRMWVRSPLPVPAPARDAQSASCYGYALAADALYAGTGLLRAASLPEPAPGDMVLAANTSDSKSETGGSSPSVPAIRSRSSLEWTPPCHGGDRGFKSRWSGYGSLLDRDRGQIENLLRAVRFRHGPPNILCLLGMLRNLVARQLWELEVAGSIPVIPTMAPFPHGRL